jgi:hypothetical protein
MKMSPSGHIPLLNAPPSHNIPVPRHNKYNVEAIQRNHGGCLPDVKVPVGQKKHAEADCDDKVANITNKASASDLERTYKGH